MSQVPRFMALGALSVSLLSPDALGQTATLVGYNFDLPGGTTVSGVSAISGDGRVIVGRSSSHLGSEGYRWSMENGLLGLGSAPGAPIGSFYSSWPRAVNADGSVIVGDSSTESGWLWNAAGGMELLSPFHQTPSTQLGGRTAGVGVSSDGGVVAVNQDLLAARWSETSGYVQLRGFRRDAYPNTALGISKDGSYIVGVARDGDEYTPTRWSASGAPEALGVSGYALAANLDGSVVVGSAVPTNGPFRWTAAGGMTGLSQGPGPILASGSAFAVSADGSVIVGSATTASGETAFYWDEQRGMRTLAWFLQHEHSLDVAGWTFTRCVGISDDGLTIVGYGADPTGTLPVWLVTLPPPLDCLPNLDGNHRIDVFDLLRYLDLWFVLDPRAEFTGDDPADVDVLDLLAFLDLWFAGC